MKETVTAVIGCGAISDIYLTNLYGDYMKLPPKDKQVPHCDEACRVELE